MNTKLTLISIGLVVALSGCVSYRSVIVSPDGTNTVSCVVWGSGNRVFTANGQGVTDTHTDIPATIGELGTLANEIGKASTPGGTAAGELLKGN